MFYNTYMNNKFYEGPIQTGKSTLIRNFLRKAYGRRLKGVAGFTSQRVIDSEGRLLGFCLAPANAEISAASPDGEFFKKFGPDGVEVCMDVFENAGVRFLDEAFAKAKSGEARIILLDEIGGHEMACEKFREKLYEILDSPFPCIGVIKMYDSAVNMDPSIASLNAELHKKITGEDNIEGEIIYYERELPGR